MEVENEAVGGAAVADREGYVHPCLLLGESEGAVQGMLRDHGTVGEGDQGVAQLALVVGGPGGYQEDLVGNTLGEVARDNEVGAGDDVADLNRHADEAEGVEDTDITVLSVMGGEGGGGDQHLIPHLRGGHLDTARDRGVEGQELGDAGLLGIEHADGGEVVGVLALACHQGGTHGEAVGLTHLGVVD